MRVLNRAFDHPMNLEEHSAMPLAGGIVGNGYQCGMVWGAALAAGAQAYRLLGAGPYAEAGAIVAAQRIVESFRALNNATDCYDLTGMDKSSSAMQMVGYAVKGGVIRCFGMAARYPAFAFNEINAALSEERTEAPSSPVSCAAMFARRMGVSDMHAVITAGLAGGIGLSGGGCGALGAAIWIDGMNTLKKAGGKLQYKAPGARDAVKRFAKCTEDKFECSKIVGRKFDSIADHASYLGNGGCAEIIEVLAATSVR